MSSPESPSPLAELAHELKTPLTAIIGYADAMIGQTFGPLGDAYLGSAEAIHAAGRHLLAVVNDMTDIARIEAGGGALAPEPFEVAELVRGTLAIFAGEAARARVTLTGPADARRIEVVADTSALRRILINLIANALRHTPAGGRVTVSLEVLGRDLRLAVDDTGPGMTDSSPAGEGLGLGLVRALAAQHHGVVNIGRAAGGGAAVVVRLPIVAGA